MFRIDYRYSSVLHECSSIIVYAWEHTDKKSLVNSKFHFLAFSVSSADLSLILSHFCHCHCCLMESICLKCLHGWLLIGPEVPNARRPFLSPNPRITVLAGLPGQHTLSEWAWVSPVLSLVFPCYTGAVTLWICQGNSCSIKYCIGLMGCVQGLVIL